MPDFPILQNKNYNFPSVFTAENLLREARRQKNLGQGQVPPICVLDPDGDLLDYLQLSHQPKLEPDWACYHTRLFTFSYAEIDFGIIGRVVGAPFAVLVAEELFASGCQLLVSITSAGQIQPVEQTTSPFVFLIEKALRDEGTSYHYLPPALYSFLDPGLKEKISANWDKNIIPLHLGTSWTTDAPFRETREAIAAHQEKGILAVEMEAAALYALATARKKNIVCFAHVTNQMAQIEGDFEKGQAQGSITALKILGETAKIWKA